jgi:hypothetical protein
MTLSIIESVISVIVSLILGQTITVPIVDWIFLLIGIGVKFVLEMIHLMFLLFSLPFIPGNSGEAMEIILILPLQFFAIIAAFLYPVLALPDVVLSELFHFPFFVMLIYDAIVRGGPPQFNEPVYGNVMHLIYNLDNYGAVIQKVLAALTYMGLSRARFLDAAIFFPFLNQRERDKLYDEYYGREPDEDALSDTTPGTSIPDDPTSEYDRQA